MADVANSSRVRIVERDIGADRSRSPPAVLHPRHAREPRQPRRRPQRRPVLAQRASPARCPRAEALTQVRERPAFAWITATPHGNEPAAGEAISRSALRARGPHGLPQRRAARRTSTLFLRPGRNPDGRDVLSRLTAWGFDPTATSARGTSPRTGSSCRRSTSTRACSSSTPTRTRATTSSRPTRTRPPRDLRLLAGLHPERHRPGDPAEVQRPEHQLPQLQSVRPLHAGVRRHRAVPDDGRGRHDVRAARRVTPTAARSTSTSWRSTRRSTSRRGTRSSSSRSGSSSGRNRSTRARAASCSRTSWSARCTTRSRPK